jgi:hypothetical protein
MGGLCTGLKRNVYMVSVRKPEGRTLLEDLHIHGRIILKFVLNK